MSNPVGRPTVMTEEVVNKLEHAFAMGCPDVEACLYANISKQTLYNYQELNPEFIDRKEALKNNPVLKARSNLMASVESGNVDDSKWLLERKKKDEFGNKSEVSLGNIDGKPLEVTSITRTIIDPRGLADTNT